MKDYSKIDHGYAATVHKEVSYNLRELCCSVGLDSARPNLIGAINVHRASGVSPIGPDSGPWMELARALAELGTEGVISALRVLLAVGTERAEDLTPEQLNAAGIASRRLLDHALGRR